MVHIVLDVSLEPEPRFIMTIRTRFRFALPAIAALVLAIPAGAQAPAPAAESAEATAVAFQAPVLVQQPAAPAQAASRDVATDALSRDGLRAGVRAQVAHERTTTVNEVVAQRSGLTHGQVLMIVGGAALLTGAIIGGDAGTLIMIGGAGVGLWGLYLYLQ